MKQIVINTCYGEFSLSHAAFLRLREMGQPDALAEHDIAEHRLGAREPSLNRFCTGIARDDRKLIQVVQELGVAANGHCADLKIVEIPPEIAWTVAIEKGIERVHEAHRQWS